MLRDGCSDICDHTALWSFWVIASLHTHNSCRHLSMINSLCIYPKLLNTSLLSSHNYFKASPFQCADNYVITVAKEGASLAVFVIDLILDTYISRNEKKERTAFKMKNIPLPPNDILSVRIEGRSNRIDPCSVSKIHSVSKVEKSEGHLFKSQSFGIFTFRG